MRLFGLNITRDTPPPVRKTFTPEQWLRGEDLDSGGSVLSNSYQQVVWVYRAINALAEQVANIPFLFSAGATPASATPRHSPRRSSFPRKSGLKSCPIPSIPGAACPRFTLQKQQPKPISPPAPS